MDRFENCDNMLLMAEYPDKYFDIAVVDPPYFKRAGMRTFYGSKASTIGVHRTYQSSRPEYWQIPTEEYFRELFRISKNQIVWGCNYFNFIFPSSGRIVWDKCNGRNSFSDCEIAYCSFHNKTRLFRFMWNGMMQGKSIQEGYIAQGNKKLNEKRIHPTQKPVALYDWILQEYAKPRDKLIDTHVGSASSLIACEKAGIEYVGCEIDPEMYKKAITRLNESRKQNVQLLDKNL